MYSHTTIRQPHEASGPGTFEPLSGCSMIPALKDLKSTFALGCPQPQFLVPQSNNTKELKGSIVQHHNPAGGSQRSAIVLFTLRG